MNIYYYHCIEESFPVLEFKLHSISESLPVERQWENGEDLELGVRNWVLVFAPLFSHQKSGGTIFSSELVLQRKKSLPSPLSFPFHSVLLSSVRGQARDLWGSTSRSCPRDFPGGLVVESLPADAGDTGSVPASGGSHVPYGSWALEPQLLSWEPVLLKRSHHSEKPARRSWRVTPAPRN